MKITVVTLYRGKSVETYVGAVAGELSDAEREAVRARLGVEDDESVDDPDMIGFQVVEVAASADALTEVLHAFP